MTIDEQINRFDRLVEFVEQELPKYAEQVLVTDLIALVSNRVIQTGKDYTGKKFKPYSTNTVAAWRFWGKSRTQSAEARIRKIARTPTGQYRGGALDYKTFRELNNLKTDKKNFEFTGSMWRKFGIVNVTPSKIQIGGTTTDAQQKIDDNSDREGVSIIEASRKEELIVQNSAKIWLESNANRILNNE